MRSKLTCTYCLVIYEYMFKILLFKLFKRIWPTNLKRFSSVLPKLRGLRLFAKKEKRCLQFSKFYIYRCKYGGVVKASLMIFVY